MVMVASETYIIYFIFFNTIIFLNNRFTTTRPVQLKLCQNYNDITFHYSVKPSEIGVKDKSSV